MTIKPIKTNKDYEATLKKIFVNYPGAIHAFSNPDADSLGRKFSMPIAYNKQADEESWRDMKEFFKEIFK